MNGSSSVTKQIGKHQYTCRKLAAGEGLIVLARLMNVIGPAIRDMQGTEANLNSVVGGLLSNEKLGDQLTFFIKAFAPHSSVSLGQGQEAELSGIFDVHFSGHYFELLQWLVFCFEVNHGNFLAEAGVSLEGVIGLIQAKSRSKSPSPFKTPG